MREFLVSPDVAIMQLKLPGQWADKHRSTIGRGVLDNARIGGCTMWKLLKSLRQDESGQDLIEYALVAALIALGAVVSMKAVSTAIGNAFATINTQLNNALGT
jgi:pilus assembly protein Flp/PilA